MGGADLEPDVHRFEARLIRRHPGRWARHFSLHLVVAAALAVMGWAARDDVFGVVPLYPWWTWALAVVSVVVGLSTLAPLNVRIQAFVGALLGALATVHVLSYGLLVVSDAVSPGARAIALYLGALWSVVLVTSTAWPKLSASAALDALEDAFRDDRTR